MEYVVLKSGTPFMNLIAHKSVRGKAEDCILCIWITNYFESVLPRFEYIEVRLEAVTSIARGGLIASQWLAG